VRAFVEQRRAVAVMADARVPETTFEDFLKIDIRVGKIVEVEDFPEARKPAWKLRVDFGSEIGVLRSSAQITNYAREELVGRLVLGVVNFPPRQVGPVRSEVLVLGTYSDAGVLLLSPEPGAALGDRVG
jgi:tRNA-binding protein